MTFDTLPGGFPDSPVAPLSINGSSIESINAAVAINERLLGSQRVTNENRYWSSNPRFSGDRTREIYTIALNTAQQINFLSLELARFPQRVWVQYLDPASNTWKPIQDTYTQAPVQMTITDSLPSRLLALSDRQNKNHPHHYGAGHWVLHRIDFRTVLTSSLRLVMVRVPGQVPRDRTNAEVAYPLGVRNCYVGLDATDREMIPRTPFVSDTERKPFASGVDMLRSNLSFSMRENRAESVSFGGVWRSAPQPIPNAVVNFYVDSRDQDGNPQVVDRFFIEPLYSGPKFNLYYSTDPVADPALPGRDDPIRTGAIQMSASLITTGRGLVFPAADGFLRVDNSGVRFDLSKPFMIGVTIQPTYDDTEAVDRVVFSAGASRSISGVESRVEDILDLRWSGTDLRWRLTYNGTVFSLVKPFIAGQTISFVAAFDGSSLVLVDESRIVVDLDGNLSTSQPAIGAEPWVGYYPDLINFGTDSTGLAADTGSYRLTNLVMKNSAGTIEDYRNFISNDDDYVVDKAYPYLDDDSTRGALLRFNDAYKNFDPTSGEGFLGFVGGSLINYDSTTWIPVNRDFEARRGTLWFNPVKASAFKFEFFDLSAQNYDSQVIINRVVRLFPLPVSNSIGPIMNSRPLTDKGGVGSKIAVDNALTVSTFSDSGSVSVNREGRADQPFSATEAIYAEDPVLADRLRSQGSALNYMRWQPMPARFRFPGEQTHRYRNVEVKHDHRVAFFAGLKELVMYRVEYTADDDTDQYLEVFHDNAFFEPDPGISSVLSFVPGMGLTSGDNSLLTLASMRSTKFSSRRQVRAIQFATTQSDPFQMLTNADFDDPSLWGWAPIGDASIESSDVYRSTIGTTVKVSRISVSNQWQGVESLYNYWSDFSDNQVTWESVMGSGSPTGSGGITGTEYVLPTAVGRVYASVRVFAPETLDNPLSIQIVAEDGQVLAEADKEILAGAVTEWYVGYTIGEGGGTLGRTWAEVETAYTLWSDTDTLLWQDVAGAVQSFTGPITARLIQKGSSRDTFYVDSISLFDDPIVWEFSNNDGVDWYPAYDIRNNPRGIFVFPDGAGSDLRWRVTIAREKSWVSAVDVRPQYAEGIVGIPYRDGIERGNGNVGHYDHYNPILVDPRFKMWEKPIPESWFFVNRQWLMRQTPSEPPTPVVGIAFLGDALINNGATPPPVG